MAIDYAVERLGASSRYVVIQARLTCLLPLAYGAQELEAAGQSIQTLSDCSYGHVELRLEHETRQASISISGSLAVQRDDGIDDSKH